MSERPKEEVPRVPGQGPISWPLSILPNWPARGKGGGAPSDSDRRTSSSASGREGPLGGPEVGTPCCSIPSQPRSWAGQTCSNTREADLSQFPREAAADFHGRARSLPRVNSCLPGSPSKWSRRKHKPALPPRAHRRRRELSVSRANLTGRPSWDPTLPSSLLPVSPPPPLPAQRGHSSSHTPVRFSPLPLEYLAVGMMVTSQGISDPREGLPPPPSPLMASSRLCLRNR